MTEIAKDYSGLPAVAIVDDRAIDAGPHMINGETITLAFINRRAAIDVADLLGASPAFREEDDSWREHVRQQQLAILDELFVNPEELRRLASQTGQKVEDLKKEELAARIFCP